MKILRITAIVAAVLGVFPLYAQVRTGAVYGDIYDSETMAAVKSHVRELSSAMYEGRKAGR